jgi:hypothetical protein
MSSNEWRRPWCARGGEECEDGEWGQWAGQRRRLVYKSNCWVYMRNDRTVAIYPINPAVPSPRDTWGSCV